MNIKQLIAFREVMLTGSVPAAGRNLHRSQPSISASSYRLYRPDGGEIAFRPFQRAIHLMASIVTPVQRAPSLLVSACVAALKQELRTIRDYWLDQSSDRSSRTSIRTARSRHIQTNG